MGIRTRIACLGVGALIGLTAATQIVAWRYDFHPALGFGIPFGEAAKLYPPWDFLIWSKTWGQKPEHHVVIRMGVSVLMFGLIAGVLLMKLFESPSVSNGGDLALSSKRQRAQGWGDPKALVEAGLTKQQGVIFGRLERESLLDRWPLYGPDLLVTPDLRPMLVTGGTRSGKGRGIVVPTLLNWNWSALIFDPKAELWATSAGFRKTLGPTLFFNPRSPYTARFNPLAEIGAGNEAVGQIKKLVDILIEPGGGADRTDFWDRQGADMLTALILHVLYTSPVEAKNLVTVRDLCADLDATAAQMLASLHIENPRATPVDDAGKGQATKTYICHPQIALGAKAYLAAHEKGRKSVQMTVRSYLSWIAGAEVEYAISASDFRIGDLMCNKLPVSLYVQVSPGDLKSLQPLVRLFFHFTASTFTTHLETDTDGRPKENALLMAMDEFPLLGKVSFFEDVVRLASGYGIKCLFIAQSLNDISRVYGSQNGFLDNAHIYVAFAALDPTTREKVSKLTGTVTETRVSSSLPHHFSGHGGSRTLAEVERPLMDVGEVGALPDDQQLIFIAGHKPYRLPKLRYDKIGWMVKRAGLSVPDQRKSIDTPELPQHPWAIVSGFGMDPHVEVELSGDNGATKRVRPGFVVPPASMETSVETRAVQEASSHLRPPETSTSLVHTDMDATSYPIVTKPRPQQDEPSGMDVVRQSWRDDRAKLIKAQKGKNQQGEFDFDVGSDVPANAPSDMDLLDRLQRGEG